MRPPWEHDTREICFPMPACQLPHAVPGLPQKSPHLPSLTCEQPPSEAESHRRAVQGRPAPLLASVPLLALMNAFASLCPCPDWM